jgi:predicted glycosyltransferase
MKSLTQDNNNLSISDSKKIWVDLDNSPHVPFFRPIIAELEKRGYPVLITARDRFQVCELVDRLNMRYRSIGRYYGKNKIVKLFWLVIRAIQLTPLVIKERPRLAISHGSRSQVIVANFLRIPSIVILDYEHSKRVPFIRPTWVIMPEIIPDKVYKKKKKRILKYPGIKEDVYVPNFEPDPRIKGELGLNGKNLVVTIRPPATEAHYHNPESEDLFKAIIDFLGHKQNIQMILLPRTDKQTAFIKRFWPEWSANGRIIIPDHVVDGLNLIWHSDLVVSGGGTMNREAAALDVPVYSIFRGKIGAVDRYLEGKGKLILLESVEDIRTKVSLTKRALRENVEKRNNATLNTIVNSIIAISEN